MNDQPQPPPLRVALFTDMYGPGPSGLLYAVQFLEGELLKDGHHVQVIAPKCDGPNPYRSEEGRTEYRLPSLKLPGVPAAVASGKGFEKALQTLASDPPDVIHVHGLGPVGLLGVWVADQAGVPLIVTWHTDFEAYAEHYSHLTPFVGAYYRLLKVSAKGMERPFSSGMSRWVNPKRWFSRGISRRNLINAARDMLLAADLVTTPSDKTARRVLEIAEEATVKVVPNGADALPEEEPLPDPGHPRLMYVGRIAHEKNIALMLRAFGWVREEIPDAELMLVGDWKASKSLSRKLKRAARHGGVTLVGQVPREKLQPYYASADVFVFPSLTDTQALVLHEAAHAGCPIVSVDDELRLVLDPGVNSLIARPSPESLARELVSMLRMLEDPEFKAAAQARSKELANKWTIANQSRDIIALYKDLAEGRPIEGMMRSR